MGTFGKQVQALRELGVNNSDQELRDMLKLYAAAVVVSIIAFAVIAWCLL